MSRFSQYLDNGYLPGEVYESLLGEARFRPMDVVEARAEKKFKFSPVKDDGTAFQKFLALQNNPELLATQAMSSSPGFFNAMSMFGGSGYN
jgi:hypothetical protein